jgi:hypothetical protein
MPGRDLPCSGPLRRGALTRHRCATGGQKVERAGLGVVRITYRNTLLSPLAILVKLLRRAQANTATRGDLVVLPRLNRPGLFVVVVLENYVARRVGCLSGCRSSVSRGNR